MGVCLNSNQEASRLCLEPATSDDSVQSVEMISGMILNLQQPKFVAKAVANKKLKAM